MVGSAALTGLTSSSEAKASSKSAAIYVASSGATTGSTGFIISASLTGSAAFGGSVLTAYPFLAFFLFFFLEAALFGVSGTSLLTTTCSSFLIDTGSSFLTGLTSSSDAKASSKSAAI